MASTIESADYFQQASFFKIGKISKITFDDIKVNGIKLIYHHFYISIESADYFIYYYFYKIIFDADIKVNGIKLIFHYYYFFL